MHPESSKILFCLTESCPIAPSHSASAHGTSGSMIGFGSEAIQFCHVNPKCSADPSTRWTHMARAYIAQQLFFWDMVLAMLGLSFAYTSTRLANQLPSTAGPYTRCQRHSVLLMTMPDMHDASRIPSARVSIKSRYPFLGVLCKMRSAEPLLLHHNAFADCTKPQACCVEELMLIGEWF